MHCIASNCFSVYLEIAVLRKLQISEILASLADVFLCVGSYGWVLHTQQVAFSHTSYSKRFWHLHYFTHQKQAEKCCFKKYLRYLLPLQVLRHFASSQTP